MTEQTAEAYTVAEQSAAAAGLVTTERSRNILLYCRHNIVWRRRSSGLHNQTRTCMYVDKLVLIKKKKKKKLVFSSEFLEFPRFYPGVSSLSSSKFT